MQCLIRFTGRRSEREEYFEFLVAALGENREYIAALSMKSSPGLNDNVSILTMMCGVRCYHRMRILYQDFKAGKRIGSGLVSIFSWYRRL